MAGVEVDPETGAVANYRNAATARDQVRGKYYADIGVNTNPDKHAISTRIKDVQQWAGDQAARAFFDPNNVNLDNAPASIVRAAAMGRAASTGDGAAMIAANQKYDIDDAYVQEFLKAARINGSGFGSAIRKQGLDEGRADLVIDPASGQRVIDLGGAGEKQFYKDRVNDLTKVWPRVEAVGLTICTMTLLFQAMISRWSTIVHSVNQMQLDLLKHRRTGSDSLAGTSTPRKGIWIPRSTTSRVVWHCLLMTPESISPV